MSQSTEPFKGNENPQGYLLTSALTYQWDIASLEWAKGTQPIINGGNIVVTGIADGADVTQGAIADAAVVTDASGTLSGKLRGLVKWAFERMPASLGQKTMAASLPVTMASDQLPWAILASDGGITGLFTVNKFGRNPDIDAGTEDIWSQGGTWVAPTAARIHAAVSTSANDTAAGTGARTITVSGLDGSYAQISETVTLNGTTPVNTVNSYTFISRLVVATAGSGGTNAGGITFTAATDATVSIGVIAGKGQSQLCIYQVPAGYTAFLSGYGGGVNGAGTSNVLLEMFAKPFGGAFNLKESINLAESGSTFSKRRFDTPLKFAEKTIIKITGTSDAANSDVVAHFDLVVVAD